MRLLGLDETADPDRRSPRSVRAKDEKILALEEKVTELGAKHHARCSRETGGRASR
jgi:hypothetical protein